MTRGIWQIGTLNVTPEEAAAVVQELIGRNISSQAIRELPEKIRVREEEEAAERKQKIASGLMWGGIGLGMVVVIIIALR